MQEVAIFPSGSRTLWWLGDAASPTSRDDLLDFAPYLSRQALDRKSLRQW